MYKVRVCRRLVVEVDRELRGDVSMPEVRSEANRIYLYCGDGEIDGGMPYVSNTAGQLCGRALKAWHAGARKKTECKVTEGRLV